MTGYGRAEIQLAPYLCSVEARSVNHRYLDASVKVPRELTALEPVLRKIVQGRIARGRVEVFINLRELPEVGGTSTTVSVNRELAAAYCEALRSLKEYVKVDGPVNLEMLAQLRDVFVIEKPGPDVERLGSKICEALAAALDELVAMRQAEGQTLLADIQQRLERLREHGDLVAARLPAIVREYREKLRQRVVALVDGLEVDAARLETEVVYVAERQDISEELVRLRSHIDHFAGLMEMSEPMGRKLDFLLQEMNRETNTIASKVADSQVAQDVVEMKSLIEQIREQVQNLQ